MTIDDIVENFELLDDWDDRYRYLIELGKTLTPLADADRHEANKVRGCVSQVWLKTDIDRADPANPVLRFVGDSDAHIVRGLVAILLQLVNGKAAREIVASDQIALFDRLDLRAHLTPQRSNGLRAMVDRVRRDAQDALAQTT